MYLRKISAFDWSLLSTFTNLNQATAFVLGIIDKLYCESFPLKLKFVGRKRLRKPWLSSEIMMMIKKKSNYFKKYKLGTISEDVNKKMRNHVNITIKKAKIVYYRNKFQNCVSEMKLIWKELRKLVACRSKNRHIAEIIEDGDHITNPKDIAQCFNNYFSKIATNLCNSLPPSDMDPLSFINRNSESLILSPVTSDEVANIIMSLKNTRQGINSISVKVLKFSRHIISQPLSHIINMSFNIGIFLEIFKPHVLCLFLKKVMCWMFPTIGLYLYCH